MGLARRRQRPAGDVGKPGRVDAAGLGGAGDDQLGLAANGEPQAVRRGDGGEIGDERAFFLDGRIVPRKAVQAAAAAMLRAVLR